MGTWGSWGIPLLGVGQASSGRRDRRRARAAEPERALQGHRGQLPAHHRVPRHLRKVGGHAPLGDVELGERALAPRGQPAGVAEGQDPEHLRCVLEAAVPGGPADELARPRDSG